MKADKFFLLISAALTVLTFINLDIISALGAIVTGGFSIVCSKLDDLRANHE